MFNLYRRLWIDSRPKMNIYSQHSLAVCQAFNAHLRHLSESTTTNSLQSLLSGIQHLTASKETQEKVDKLCSEFSFNEEVLELFSETLSGLFCCRTSSSDSLAAITAQSSFQDSFESRTNLVRCLSKIHIEHQPLALKSFAKFVDHIDAVLCHNDVPPLFPESLVDLSKNPLGRLSFLFSQAPGKQRQFFTKLDSALKLLNSCIDLAKVEFGAENFSLEKLTGGNGLSMELIDDSHQSILHSLWIDNLIASIYFGVDELKNPGRASLKVTLGLFDLKIAQLKEIALFLWENNERLSSIDQFRIDSRLTVYLADEIQRVKVSTFNGDDYLYDKYLRQRCFDPALAEISKEAKRRVKDQRVIDLVQGIILAVELAHVYAPCDPLDPLEYEALVEKCDKDQAKVKDQENKISKYLSEFRLQTSPSDYFNEQPDVPNLSSFFTIRQNRSEFFLVKNEIENALKQFCSCSTLSKFIKEFCGLSNVVRSSEVIEREFQIWTQSLESFVNKIKSEYFSFVDLVCLPATTLGLIGHSLRALFTLWKCRHQNSQNFDPLLQTLQQFPYRKTAHECAQVIIDSCDHLKDLTLVDELHLVALMHLANSNNKDKVSGELLNKICAHFQRRHLHRQETLEALQNVDSYKYKTYGQKEIEQEIEDEERAAQFPSYTSFFQDLVAPATLEDTIVKTKEEAMQVFRLSFQFIDLFA